jgi:hypothetical protein
MRQPADARVPEWIPVSARWPCPRCGAPTGCAAAADAAAVRRRAVPSERPFAGGGWFHPARRRARPDRHGRVLRDQRAGADAEEMTDRGETRGRAPRRSIVILQEKEQE